MFKDGRTNVHDEERSGRPSAVSDDLVQSERQHFTIFCVNFHKLHALFSTRLSQLGYAITSSEQDSFQKY
jgi:hypothetical protein